MHEHGVSGGGIGFFDIVAPLVAILAVVGYLWAASVTRGQRWPRYRTMLWVLGISVGAAAVTGPLAQAADRGFPAHMAAHLLLGMLAPLLLVLAAPVTLLLRALPVPAARAVSRVLRSMPLRVLIDPAVAALLNVGGLWILYTTSLYAMMHTNPAVGVLVHLHMFLAGYLFTVSIVDVDPMPHRRSYPYRAVVLVVALAAHGIVAKYLYAHPPAGVDTSAAEIGAMIMYYGGDAVDLALIVLLCSAWYRATRPDRGTIRRRNRISVTTRHQPPVLTSRTAARLTTAEQVGIAEPPCTFERMER